MLNCINRNDTEAQYKHERETCKMEINTLDNSSERGVGKQRHKTKHYEHENNIECMMTERGGSHMMHTRKGEKDRAYE